MSNLNHPDPLQIKAPKAQSKQHSIKSWQWIVMGLAAVLVVGCGVCFILLQKEIAASSTRDTAIEQTQEATYEDTLEVTQKETKNTNNDESASVTKIHEWDTMGTKPGTAGKETILIGGLAPLTGEIAIYGNSVKNAAEMAFDEINAAGGVLGRQIEYTVLDEMGDAGAAINAYNILMEKDIVALLGDVTSKPSIAVAELAAQDGILMLTPTASSPDVTKAGSNIFRVCFLDPYQGAAMATFAKDFLDAKTVAVLYNTSDDYSTGLAASFKTQAETLGLTVVNYEGYGADDADFQPQLAKIASSNPDVLFAADYYDKDSLLAAQARGIGIAVPILGADGWDGVVTAVEASNISVLNDVYFTNQYSVQDPSPNVTAFVSNYTAKFGETPNALAALGYDAAYMIAKAISTAGSTDSAAIVKAMSGIQYEGVTGSIRYSGTGDPIKSVTITRIVDGKYTYFGSVDSVFP